jgi:hypothetical protein
MNSTDIIVANIVSDVNIIAFVYDIIKNAGKNATDNDEVKMNKDKICILKSYKVNINRSKECYLNSKNKFIEYDANNIIIVGGAALNIYDYLLREFKGRRQITELENYIKKKTTDIDLVWWPEDEGYSDIISIDSIAIKILVDKFVQQLRLLFNNNSVELLNRIREYIPNIKNDDKLETTVFYNKNKKAGVYNIVIDIYVKKLKITLCEIAVHDGGASQEYTLDGSSINKLLHMTDDPMYSTPVQQEQSISIKYINIGDTKIAVPRLITFVKQQILAFNNFIRDENQKGLINYKRVEYIKQLISKITFPNNSNVVNTFKINSNNSKQQIINEIDNLISKSIVMYHNNLHVICSENKNKIKNTKDDIVKELCDKIQKIYNDKQSTLKIKNQNKSITITKKTPKAVTHLPPPSPPPPQQQPPPMYKIYSQQPPLPPSSMYQSPPLPPSSIYQQPPLPPSSMYQQPPLPPSSMYQPVPQPPLPLSGYYMKHYSPPSPPPLPSGYYQPPLPPYGTPLRYSGGKTRRNNRKTIKLKRRN